MPDINVLGLLSLLARLGVPISALANLPSSVGGGLGAVGSGLGLIGAAQAGNIPGAVGQGANLARRLANLADFPDVGNALGAAGGAVGIGARLAAGDYGGAAAAAPAALGSGVNAAGSLGLIPASSASAIAPALGAAGGLAGMGYSLAQGDYGGAAAAAPAAAAAGAEAAGAAGVIAPATASAIASSLSAIALPIALTYLAAGSDSGGDDLFSGPRNRMREYNQAVEDLPRAWQEWAQAAGLKPAEAQTPEQIRDAFKTATQGVRAQELGPAYDLISLGQGQHDPGLHENPKPYVAGHPMPELQAAAPKVTGEAWKNWATLADRAEKAGVDWRSIAQGSQALGRRRLGPGEQIMPNEDYGRQAIDIVEGNNMDPTTNAPRTWAPGDDPRFTTREAYDLSQAIYGRLMAEGRGINGPLPGARGGGGYLAPDQLAGFGMTPGNYETGILNYIAQMANLGPAIMPPVGSTPPAAIDNNVGGF